MTDRKNPPMTKERPTLSEISRHVSKSFGLPIKGKESIGGNRRSPTHTTARGMIVLIARHFNYPYEELATHAGYASHSSAVHIERKIIMRETKDLPELNGEDPVPLMRKLISEMTGWKAVTPKIRNTGS